MSTATWHARVNRAITQAGLDVASETSRDLSVPLVAYACVARHAAINILVEFPRTMTVGAVLEALNEADYQPARACLRPTLVSARVAHQTRRRPRV